MTNGCIIKIKIKIHAYVGKCFFFFFILVYYLYCYLHVIFLGEFHTVSMVSDDAKLYFKTLVRVVLSWWYVCLWYIKINEFKNQNRV